MTNPVSDEIHQLTLAAMDGGEQIVPIHVFPFRMTDKNMTAQDASPWKPFWTNLKEGYDLFEQTKRPPIISVCSGRYIFRETQTQELAGPLEACGPTLSAIREQEQWLRNVPYPVPFVPRLASQSTAANRPIPQLQSNLDSDSALVPVFSWPLIR